MITRSAFILGFATAAFATGAAAQEVALKFSHFLGPKSFFQLDVVEPWAKELEARTNGKVKVETFDGTSAVGGVTEQASNVKAGKVDIALGLRGAEGDKFLGSSVIELPFVVPSALRGSQALWGLYKDGTLANEYARIVENLRRQYVIGYTSTNSRRDGAWRAVSVTSRKDGVKIASRGGYFAPAR